MLHIYLFYIHIFRDIHDIYINLHLSVFKRIYMYRVTLGGSLSGRGLKHHLETANFSHVADDFIFGPVVWTARKCHHIFWGLLNGTHFGLIKQ